MKKIIYIVLFMSLFLFGKVETKALEEGTYIIQSALNNNLVADVYYGVAKNEANVQLYTNNETVNQMWDVKPIGDGYYTIKSALNNKFSLDVYRGAKINGTNAELYTFNNTDNQQWLLKDAGGGYYYIISKCNNLALDVYRAKAASGTNLQLYKQTQDKNQKFKFVKTSKPSKTIENGTYIIQSALNDNLVVDVKNGYANKSNNVQINTANNRDSQKWDVKYLGDGYYSIVMKANNGFALDVQNAGKSAGANADIYYTNNSYSYQNWIIRDAGDGYYYIISKHNNLALDVYRALATSGTNLELYTKTGGQNQKFKFKKVTEKAIPDKTLEDGTYIIQSALNSKMVLDLHNNVTKNGSNIELYTHNGNNNQKWNVKYLDDGYYSITTALSDNMTIDVAGASNKAGTNVALYTLANKQANQEWLIKDAGGGYYFIVSKLGNAYLDVAWAEAKNGSNIDVYTYNGNPNQKFKFVSTEVNQDQKQFEGKYSFTSMLNTNQAIDINQGYTYNNQNTILYKNSNNKNQLWYVDYVGNGYYAIKSLLNRNIALTVKDNNATDGQEIVVYRFNKSNNNQLWRIKNYGNDIIAFVSKSSELYITSSNNTATGNPKLILKSKNDSNAQKFKATQYTKEVAYHGIDISHHNTGVTINWDAIAKNTDINFVIIHAGYGKDWGGDGTGTNDDQMDPNYLNFVKACEDRNIPYAVYLYSYAKQVTEINIFDRVNIFTKTIPSIPDTDSKSSNDIMTTASTPTGGEATHMLNLLDKIKKLNKEHGYVPTLGTQAFFDMENASTITNKATLTNIADTFCQKVQKGGYSCGIYANKKWFENYLDANALAKKYTLWFARYPWDPSNGGAPAIAPTYQTAENNRSTYLSSIYKYWQFTSKAHVNGISGYVDLDIGYNIFDK